MGKRTSGHHRSHRTINNSRAAEQRLDNRPASARDGENLSEVSYQDNQHDATHGSRRLAIAGRANTTREGISGQQGDITGPSPQLTRQSRDRLLVSDDVRNDEPGSVYYSTREHILARHQRHTLWPAHHQHHDVSRAAPASAPEVSHGDEHREFMVGGSSNSLLANDALLARSADFARAATIAQHMTHNSSAISHQQHDAYYRNRLLSSLEYFESWGDDISPQNYAFPPADEAPVVRRSYSSPNGILLRHRAMTTDRVPPRPHILPPELPAGDQHEVQTRRHENRRNSATVNDQQNISRGKRLQEQQKTTELVRPSAAAAAAAAAYPHVFRHQDLTREGSSLLIAERLQSVHSDNATSLEPQGNPTYRRHNRFKTDEDHNTHDSRPSSSLAQVHQRRAETTHHNSLSGQQTPGAQNNTVTRKRVRLTQTHNDKEKTGLQNEMSGGSTMNDEPARCSTRTVKTRDCPTPDSAKQGGVGASGEAARLAKEGSSSYEQTDKRQSNRQAVQRYRQKKKSEFASLQAENAGLRKQVQELGNQLEAAISSRAVATADAGQVVISSEEFEELQMLREFKARVTSSVLHRELENERHHHHAVRGYFDSNSYTTQRGDAFHHLFRHHRHP